MGDIMPDTIKKVAELGVYVKKHEEELKKLSKEMNDLYGKYDGHEKEYRQVLVQMKGMCTEFSTFAIQLKELKGVPDAFAAHKLECENYRANDGFFKFWKNNPIRAAEYVVAGSFITLAILVLSGSDPGMMILKFILGLFGIKV